jgi:cytoskeletal protein RodZ
MPRWRDLARLPQDQELVEMEPLHRTETPPQARTVGADEASAAPPEGVGELLRQKRESFRQDLKTVAGQLHIRLSYLKAIEDGRFKDLPGPTYAAGFVRSYSDYLGLDGAEMVRRFREEIAGINRQVQLIFPSLATEGKIPSGAILLLSGFLAIMAYGVWYYLADRQKSFLDLVPEVPAQLRAFLGAEKPPNNRPSADGASKPAAVTTVASAGPAASHDTPIANAPVAAAPPAEPAPPPPAAPLAPPPPAAAPAATSVLVSPNDLAPLPTEITTLFVAAEVASAAANTTAAGASTSTTAATPASSAGTTTANTGGAPATTPVKPAGKVVIANPDARVKLTARMDSWVQIYDKAGKSYFSAVLRAGQIIEVPNQPGLLLTTGNIGGLDILIDGQALAALGSVGMVKRNLPLDAAGLKSASAASQ